MMSYAFTSSVAIRATRSVGRCTCNVRKTVPPRAMAEAWNAEEWRTSGRSAQPSGLQEIEYIIRQDGTVEEKVTGVRGKDCVEIAAKIEEALGTVVHSEKTDEYFQQVFEDVQVRNEVKDRAVQPGDPFHVSDPNILSW